MAGSNVCRGAPEARTVSRILISSLTSVFRSSFSRAFLLRLALATESSRRTVLSSPALAAGAPGWWYGAAGRLRKAGCAAAGLLFIGTGVGRGSQNSSCPVLFAEWCAHLDGCSRWVRAVREAAVAAGSRWRFFGCAVLAERSCSGAALLRLCCEECCFWCRCGWYGPKEEDSRCVSGGGITAAEGW